MPFLSFPFLSSILLLYICPCLSICLNLLNQRANTTSEPLSAHLSPPNLMCFVSQAACSLTQAILLNSSIVLLIVPPLKNSNLHFKLCLYVDKKIPSWMPLWWIKHYKVPSLGVWWSAFSILYICRTFCTLVPLFLLRPQALKHPESTTGPDNIPVTLTKSCTRKIVKKGWEIWAKVEME